MSGDIHVRMSFAQNTWRDRLHHLAHPEDGLADHMTHVLDEAFADTQDIVHVITGSLKASGKTDSSYERSEKEWTGTITYGGPSAGSINDPVKYAWYEQRRGGPHDFMANIHHHVDAFGEALASWMVS